MGNVFLSLLGTVFVAQLLLLFLIFDIFILSFKVFISLSFSISLLVFNFIIIYVYFSLI